MASKLPGGLGKAINETLGANETILKELHFAGGGEGMTITDRRVLIVKGGYASQAMFGQKIKSYPFDKINSVEVSAALMVGRIQLNVSGSSEANGRGNLNKTAQAENLVQIARAQLKEAREMAELIEQQRVGVNKSALTEPGTDLTGQLERLANLLERGVLTEAEFKQAKEKLLA